MTVQIDDDDPTTLHEQVAAQLRRAIADGECAPGERLPPAVDLAAVLGVNRNTVLRALRTLRDEGIVDFRRGRGVTVTATAPRDAAVIEAAKHLLDIGRRNGYPKAEIIQLIEQLP